MYKRNSQLKGLALIAILVILAVIILIRLFLFSSPNQAEDLVQEFYKYEQQADFSNSWNLFHSEMKEKFSKGHYIQDRAHVFMNHFGVDTFTFKTGDPEKLSNWKMSKESKAISTVYKVPVTQHFKGKYGAFNIEQNVFVAKEKGEWRILWDYKK